MPKAYWVTCYRSISDPQKVAAYAKLAPLATAPFGARYIARGTAAAAFESGQVAQGASLAVQASVDFTAASSAG